MGAIVNGMAAHGGVIPFGATFLIFSDYMRPPIRLAALMELQVIYVFTHDSIGVGEDGPTHQPVEQLATLRAIPGLIVIRPGDANETAVAWRVAIEIRDRPVALVLTPAGRADARPDALWLGRKVCGAGRMFWPMHRQANRTLILIATGSEVGLIVAARHKLQEQEFRVRIVSMPSWELFEAQPASIATRSCRHPSRRGSRSRRASPKAGTATSATAAM